MHQYEAAVSGSSVPECSEDGDDPDLEGSRRPIVPLHPNNEESLTQATWLRRFGDYVAPLKARSRSRPRENGLHVGVGAIAEACGLSWLSLLLVLVPLAIATHAMHIRDQNVVFLINAAAIIPLTSILTRTTENMSDQIGVALGALLNITLGNMVELIMLIFMLREGHYDLVMSSLLGSMLVNILLILGLSVWIGGLRYREQKWDVKETRMLVFGTAFGALSILVPTMTFASARDKTIADMIILKLSRAISILLLILYIASIMLQIQAATRLNVPQHANDVGEEDEGRPFMAYERREYEERTPTREQRHWQYIEKPFISEHLKMVLSVIMLVISAGLASACANNMVSATEHVLSHTPLTKAFLV